MNELNTMKKILSAMALVALFISQSEGSSGDSHNKATDAKPTAGESCELNYPAFEMEVPHFDLTQCPPEEKISMSAGFCRLAIIGDKSYLYTFELKGTSLCLTDAKEVPLSDYLTR